MPEHAGRGVYGITARRGKSRADLRRAAGKLETIRKNRVTAE